MLLDREMVQGTTPEMGQLVKVPRLVLSLLVIQDPALDLGNTAGLVRAAVLVVRVGYSTMEVVRLVVSTMEVVRVGDRKMEVVSKIQEGEAEWGAVWEEVLVWSSNKMVLTVAGTRPHLSLQEKETLL